MYVHITSHLITRRHCSTCASISCRATAHPAVCSDIALSKAAVRAASCCSSSVAASLVEATYSGGGGGGGGQQTVDIKQKDNNNIKRQ